MKTTTIRETTRFEDDKKPKGKKAPQPLRETTRLAPAKKPQR